MNAPIELYYWSTPNGWKVSIMLEECGLDYHVTPVDIGSGDQFTEAFLAINPNNKIPAITDPDGPDGQPISLFESGAILIYLAEKTGRFLPAEPRARYAVLQWLMLQMGGIGPMLGQAHHFRIYAPHTIDYAVDRYTNEATRLYRMLDQHLADHEHLAGDYSIADMATFPWISRHDRQGQDMADYPNLNRWYRLLQNRPALRRGMDLLKDSTVLPAMNDGAREVLFGKTQVSRGAG